MKLREELARAFVTRPASRWRNKYLALCNLGNAPDIIEHRRGEDFWAEKDWPSRDTAETYAQQWICENPGRVEHLGAFPAEGA